MSRIEKHPSGSPCWFDLMTQGGDAARAFYASLFGWEITPGDPEMGNYSMALLDGEPVAGIGEPPGDAASPAVWSVYFATEDIERSCSLVKENGGQVLVPPMVIPDAGTMAVCADASGAVFGLWQMAGHAGSAWTGKPGTMAWCEVNARDADDAKSFYEAVLGLRGERMDMPMTTYYTLSDSEPRAGILQMTAEWGDMPPHWMIYFAVADADAAAKQVEALGGRVAHGPFDSPYGRIVVVADGQGATFSLVEVTESR